MSIGEDKLISNLVKLDIYGNKNGKINVFNGNIVRTPTEYLNRIIFSLDSLLSNIAPSSIDQKPSTNILRELGNKVGFYFIGDIMLSDIWKKEVLPMINNNDDWVLGAVSILNSMGIGRWKIKDFHPNKRLILNLHDSYESNYYLEKRIRLETKHPVCNISTGIAAAIMSLVYDAKLPEQKINKISYKMYKNCCMKNDSYVGKELRCKVHTHDHCEIIVERNID